MVNMSLHVNTVSWCRANQYLSLLLYAYSLDWLELKIYCTRREHTNYYTTDAISVYGSGPIEIKKNILPNNAVTLLGAN